MRTLFSVLIVCCFASHASAQQALTQTEIDEFNKAVKVEVDREKQLKERDFEILRLKEEIESLRAVRSDGDTHLFIHARFIEVTTAKVETASLDGVRSVLIPFLDPNRKERPLPRVATLPVVVCDSDSPLLAQIDRWLADPTKPAQTLGAPAISTLLERQAYIRIGHEFPMLVPMSLGATSLEHRFYGTRLAVTGSLRRDGRLALEIQPRHSELDPSRSVKLNGQEVPGLTVRECAFTTVISPEQQIVVGGMTGTRTVTTQPARVLMPAKTATEETELLIVISVKLEPGPSKPNP